MDIARLKQLRPYYANLDDDQIVDLVQKHDYPDRSRDDIAKALGVKLPAPAQPALPERSLFGAINDSVINVANSAAGVVKSGVDLFAPDSPLSQGIADFITMGQEKQSDKQKALNRQLSADLQNAEGPLDKAGAYVKHALTADPLKTASDAAGNVLPFMGAGRLLAATRAPGAVATAANMGLAGIVGAGEVRGNIWDKISRTPDADLLEQSPEYAELRIQRGMTEAQAKQELGANLSRNLPEVGAVGALGALSGKFGLEGMAAGVAPKMGRVGSAAVGLADEALQGGAEQVATNKGVQRALPEQSLLDDVPLNMAMEGLGGMLGGAALGGRERVPDAGPLSRAANTALDQREKEQAAQSPLLALPAPTIRVTEGGQAITTDPRMGGILDVTPVASAREEEDAAILAAARAAQQSPEQAMAQSQANIAMMAGRQQPTSLEMAQARVAGLAEQAGIEASVIPHPGGRGFMVIPSAWVAEPMRQQVAQGQQAGMLPSPDMAAPDGPLVADPQGLRPQTYAEQQAARQAVRDVLDERDRMAQMGLTPDVERTQRTRALAQIQPGDVMTPAGMPFKTEGQAKLVGRKKGFPRGRVLQVRGGWVFRPAAETVDEKPLEQDALQAAAGESAPPAEPQGADARGPGQDAAGSPAAGIPEAGRAADVQAAGLKPKAMPTFLKTKTVPQMTAEELREAQAYYGPNHKRAKAIEKALAKIEQQQVPKADNLPAVKPSLSVEFGGKTYPVESVEDALQKWVKFQETAGAGVSQVGNGVEVKDQTGKVVGRISYNGRAWDADGNLVAEAPTQEAPKKDDAPQYDPAKDPLADKRAPAVLAREKKDAPALEAPEEEASAQQPTQQEHGEKAAAADAGVVTPSAEPEQEQEQEQPSAPQPEETPQITESEARKRLEWRDLGQSDGTKTWGLYFKDADGGTLRYGTVSKYAGSRWEVDNHDGGKYEGLQPAKKKAEDIAVERLRQHGYVVPAEAAATPEAKTEAPARKRAAKPEQKIADFGEKLEGARKDYASALKDAMEVDVKTAHLSKSWPEPDYQKLLDGGSDPFMVSFIHAARDEIPTKPAKAWKLKGWAAQVEMLRDMAQKLLSGEISQQRLREMLAEPKFELLRSKVGGRAELYEAVGHGKSLKGVEFAKHHYAIYRGEQNVTKWVISQQAKATAFSNWPREIVAADTKDGALAQFKAKYDDLDLGPKAKGQPQFDIYRRRGTEGAIIGKKIGREYIDLKKFADVKEARAYLQDNLAELEKALEQYKATPLERRPDNQPRVGEDHRNGAPVTPEVFAETFGFRGVQFGNYVEQARRQSDLNEAYDALMDLAAVLGVPPRALSLNGTLGLAFGARGRGGKGAPIAHFEGDKVVINLTKAGGPGSLAHEWWHSVDNYFARQSVEKSTDFVTGGAVTDRMRQKLREAFAAVKVATQAPTLRRRAALLDKRKSKPYWNTPVELSARAFESYVIAKLQDQGAANDYLANIVDPEVWGVSESMRADALGQTESETYPYPLPAELPAVRAAFDDFFKTVETRTDDAGNVAMFNRSASERDSARIELPQDLLEQVRAKFGDIESDFRAATGYGFDALTESEARYLARHDSPQRIRNRISEAGSAASQRLDEGRTGEAQRLTARKPTAESDFERGDGLEEAVDFDYESLTARAEEAHVQTVETLVLSIVRSWKNAPEIVVLSRLEQAPVWVQQENERQIAGGAQGVPAAFFYGGKAYIMASEMKTIADVRKAVFHEVLGHLGLRGLYGKQLDKILAQVWAVRRDQVVDKGLSYGMDMNERRDQLKAAEEVLAEMAETNPSLGFVRRAIAAIRSWLRVNVPALSRMKMTDDEIINEFILPAQRFVKRGPQGPDGRMAPAFRRRDAGMQRSEKAGTGFSRTAAAEQYTGRARELAQDFLGSAGTKVDWLDRTFKTQYAKAQKFPEFGKVFNRLQQYIESVSSLANQAADRAPSILPKLESVSDLWKHGIWRHGLKAEDKQAIAAPIFEGTLEWARKDGALVRVAELEKEAEGLTTAQKEGRLLRDRKVSPEQVKAWKASKLDVYDGAIRNAYEREYLAAGVVFTDAELRDRFSLTPEQIGQYREFRAAVNESLDEMAAAEVVRLVPDLPADVAAMAETAEGRKGLREAVEAFLGDENNDLWNQVQDKFNQVEKLKERGYAPLSRFGKFYVHVVDATGATQFFGLAETRYKANALAREMRGEYPGATIDQGVMSQQQYKLMSAVPLDSMELFASAIGADQSEVFQKYIQLAKNNRSTMKRLIRRKGTAGFSDDVPRVLANFVTSNARAASAALHVKTAKEMAQEIQAGDVKDEAVKLIQAVTEPEESGAAIRGLMFMNFIAGSIASALVNTTQPVTMTLPYLSQWGGASKAAARLVEGARMAVTRAGGDAELRAALKRAADDGVVSPQEIHQLAQRATGGLADKNPIIQKLAFVWSSPFSLAEQFNRRATFIAAYRTAQQEGIADPFGFAEKAVIETQGLYTAANKPNWARGVAGATAMTFKQYSIHYLEWLSRMARSGKPGQKAALLALAMLFLAAGADGLPFMDDMDDVIDTVGQAMGYDTNTKRWRHQAAAAILGDELGEVATRGFSAMGGFPIDVSMRMGMGNLLPATDLLMKSNTDTARSLSELAGPGGALFIQYRDAAKAVLAGDLAGAAQKAVPVAMQNVAKAGTMFATGEYRDQRGRKVADADLLDAGVKALGFQPSQIARESGMLADLRQSESLARMTEGEITDKWARAIVDGDREAEKEALAMRDDWNEKNPDMPIVVKRSQAIRKARQMRMERKDRFLKTVAPERRKAAQREMET